MNETVITELLRITYNGLRKRRNPDFPSYDIFCGSSGNRAKGCFKSLAKRLAVNKIDPVKFIKVLSVYGKFKHTRHLPWPSFLCSDKAFEIYKWKSQAEAKNYLSESQMQYGLTQGLEITPKEILGAVKESVDQLKKVKAKITPAILYAVRDGLKPWYLALRKDFLNEYFYMLDKDERKQIKSCRSFYKQNRWLKQKAKELV